MLIYMLLALWIPLWGDATYSPQLPTEVETSIYLTSPSQANLFIRETQYGQEAHEARQNIEQVGLESYSQSCLRDVQNRYKGAIERAPVKITDDRDRNKLVIEKYYQISTQARPGNRFLGVLSHTHGYVLAKSAPYKMRYPAWVKEHIHIENPFAEWKLEEERFEDELQSVQYAYHRKQEGHVADFTYELRYLHNQISASEEERYVYFVDEIEPHSFQELYIAPAGLPPQL